MDMKIELGNRNCVIGFGHGIINKAGEYFDLDRRVMVVTDSGVPEDYAGALVRQATTGQLHIIPQGEGSKSFPYLERLLSHMLEERFNRHDCVVAVGGGVVGDLAGFAASCYMRGIDFYNVPTTLLSQVDSSIGGKTGIDLCGNKNMVGSFYQPKAVLIDPDTLKTLPAREMRCGYAEAVKMALTCDADLFRIFEENVQDSHTDEIITRCLAIKKNVVEKDERESGLRRVLNFGHTIGHGIESVTGLRHGECVALGMIPMCGNDLRKRLIRVLENLGLKTGITFDADAVYSAILHDKKTGGGLIETVRVDVPGSFRFESVRPGELKDLISLIAG